MARYRLFAEQREGDKLVVTHIFHGASEKEAVHYYESHLKTDEFLRACTADKNFQGTPCTTTFRWEVEE